MRIIHALYHPIFSYHGTPYLPPTATENKSISRDFSHDTHAQYQLDIRNSSPVSQPRQSLGKPPADQEPLASLLSTKIHTTNIFPHTDKLPFDSTLNLSLQLEHRGSQVSLWKRFKEAALSASQLWTGVLYNGDHKLCPIKLRTYYPPSFSLHFSEFISIELATHFDLFFKEFPRGLFTTVSYLLLSLTSVDNIY